jgi:hypothetical protein
MADRTVAIRVCPAWMPAPSLPGGIHGVPYGKGLVCLTIRAISDPLKGDPDETMTMAEGSHFGERQANPRRIACTRIHCGLGVAVQSGLLSLATLLQ